MVVGHRATATFDNTLAGVLSDSGRGRRVDVRMSSDGLLVLAHDPQSAGARPRHPVGRPGGPAGGLCQLEEALAVPGRVCIEVKNIPGEEGFDPHGRVVLLAASRARPTDVIAGFYWPDLDLIRSRAPEVATCLVVGVGGSPADAVSYAGERGHAAISVDHTLIDGSLLELASAAGVRVMAWTVDDPRRARELFAMGVTAIISDDPESLRDVRSAR